MPRWRFTALWATGFWKLKQLPWPSCAATNVRPPHPPAVLRFLFRICVNLRNLRTDWRSTSKERVDHVKSQGRTEDLEAAREGSAFGSNASAGLEESHWLCPVEDRRRLDSTREGMIEGFALGSYRLLVDCAGKLFREGKAVISREVAEIFELPGSSAEIWQRGWRS